MAIQFTASSSERIRYDVDAAHNEFDSLTALTVVSWVYADALSGSNRNIVSKWDFGAGNKSFVLVYSNSSSKYLWEVVRNDEGHTDAMFGPDTDAVDQWQHVSGRWSTTTRDCWVDGAAGTANTISRTAVEPQDGIDIVIASQHDNSNFFDGQIAEVCIWDAYLSDEEMVSLSKGLRPNLIRPANVIFYPPLYDTNYDVDLARGVSGTPANTPTNGVEHPTITAPMVWVVGSPVASGAQTITLNPGTLTLAGVAATITPGSVAVSVTPGTLTLAGVAAGVVAGAVSISTSPGALSLTGVAVGVTVGAVTITLSPGTLTLTGVSATVTPGAVSVSVTPGTLTLAGVSVSITNGVVIALTPGTLTLAGVAATITPGAVVVSVTPGALTLAGVSVVVSVVSAQVITVSPGLLVLAAVSVSVSATLRADWTVVDATLYEWTVVDATLYEWTVVDATQHEWTVSDSNP